MFRLDFRSYRVILLGLILFSVMITTTGVENNKSHLIGRMVRDRVVVASLDDPENVIVELDNVTLFNGDPDLEWLLHPHEIKLSSNQEQIAFVTVKPNMYKLNIITLSTLEHRDIAIPYPATIAWSPNANSIFISLFRRLYIDRVYQYQDPVTGFIYDVGTNELREIPVTRISHVQWSDENEAFLIGRDNDSGEALYKVSADGDTLVKLTDFANNLPFPDRTVTRICPPMTIDPQKQLIYLTERCDDTPSSRSNILSVSAQNKTVNYVTDLTEFVADDITGIDTTRPITVQIINNNIYVALSAFVWSSSGNTDGWRVLKINEEQNVDVVFETRRDYLDSLHHAEFSPDGDYVALAGRGNLLVVNLNNGQMWETTLNKGNDESVCSFHWMNDSELIFDTSDVCTTSAGDFVNRTTGSIFKFDAITKSLVTLVENDAWIIQ